MASKASVLVFYLRIARNTHAVLRWASWAVLSVVVVAGTILTVMNIFQCRPVWAAWTPIVHVAAKTTGRVECLPILTEFICSAPVDIITDLAILALPIPVLTSISLPTRQKVVLVGTFALGAFVTIVDVVRIYYLQEAVTMVPSGSTVDADPAFGQEAEFAWNASLSLLWSAVEVNVIVTCACVPTLRPLIVHIPTKIRNQLGSGSGRHGSKRSEEENHERAGDRRSPVVSGGGGSGVVMRSGGSARDAAADVVAAQAPMASGGQNAAAMSSHMQEEIDALRFITTVETAGQSAGNDQEAGDGGAAWHIRRTWKPVQGQQPPTASQAGDVNRAGRPRRPKKKQRHFGFVDMSAPRSMLTVTGRQSLMYCSVVSILFVLWGVSFGIVNELNGVVAGLADMSEPQMLGLTSVYFGGGYFFGPLVGGWCLRHNERHLSPFHFGFFRNGDTSGHDRWRGSGLGRRLSRLPGEERFGGFTATFIAGLCIYGSGTIMFWPSAVTLSFPGFMVCNFVVGCGLAVLETAANPFLALCGPQSLCEMRLLLAQGAQAVGTVVAIVLAQLVFFDDVRRESNGDGSGSGSGSGAARTSHEGEEEASVVRSSTTLINVQWTYLAVTLGCVVLALLFYYMPLPEVTDAELDTLNLRRDDVDPESKVAGVCYGRRIGVSLRTLSLALAVAAQWTYVGAHISLNIFFAPLLAAWLPSVWACDCGDGNSRPVLGVPDQLPGLALSVSTYKLIAHAVLAFSRFVVGGMCYMATQMSRRAKGSQEETDPGRSGWTNWSSLLLRAIFVWPQPRTLLLMCALLALAVGVTLVSLRPASPQTLLALEAVFFLAVGPIWPLVFALALRGQGGNTKLAAALVTMGASGPAFWPFVMYAIASRRPPQGGEIQDAFIVVVLLFVLVCIYPVALSVVPGLRVMVDPVAGDDLRRGDADDEDDDEDEREELDAPAQPGRLGLAKTTDGAPSSSAAPHVSRDIRPSPLLGTPVEPS